MGKKIKIKRVKVRESPKKPNTEIKNKLGEILCIVLKEGKGSKWIWLDESENKFSLDENTYFKVDEGTYLKDRIRLMVYLEGISLPIHHGHIEKEEVTRDILDKDTGKTKKLTIQKIKGLNFDSKVIDILLNRNLADEFTKQHVDLPNLIIIILLIGILITNLITIGLFFR
jgi:hypothetical protein